MSFINLFMVASFKFHRKILANSKDATSLFLQVFQDELDSKIDLRIRLNWLLAFYNIYAQNLAGPIAKLTTKVRVQRASNFCGVFFFGLFFLHFVAYTY